MEKEANILHNKSVLEEQKPLTPFKLRLISLSALAGIIAPVFFIGVFTIAGFLRPGYSLISQVASDLGRGSDGWIFNWALRLFGVLTICFAPGFFLLLRSLVDRTKAITVLVLLCLSGLAAIGGGIFVELDPQNLAATATSGLLHGACFLTLVITLIIALFIVGSSFLPVPDLRKYGVYSLITALATVILNIVPLLVPTSLHIAGLLQRILETEAFAWYVVMGVLLLSFVRSQQHEHGQQE
jgi:hypothetical membrane protein